MSEAQPILRVEQLTKAYPGLTAVRALSFTVAPGQMLAMVGPNGAGKTTTMRTIAGILSPTSGTVLVGGADVVQNPVQAKRRLAYVPDDPRLFETLTVWEHLEFFAAAYDLRDWKSRAEKLLEEFELTPKKNTVGAELSRGMRQKTAACCAYLHEPQLLMMDEPMTGLDPRGIRTMKQSLAAAASSGTAVVISSHLLDVVEDLCDSVLIMHKGRSLFEGPIREARQAVAQDRPGGTADLSLEEVFFKLTEQSDLSPPTMPVSPSMSSPEPGSTRVEPRP